MSVKVFLTLHVLRGQEMADVPIPSLLPCTAALGGLTSWYLPCKASSLQIKTQETFLFLCQMGQASTTGLPGSSGCSSRADGDGDGASSACQLFVAWDEPLCFSWRVLMWARSALAFPAGSDEEYREGTGQGARAFLSTAERLAC